MIDMMEQKTILIVDDENMMREAVASYLEKQGYHVLQAETGTQALSLLEKETVSFVILDLMLPDISGEEICSRIRRQSRIPIIMLTAKTMEDDMLNGLNLGADDYITKPFSLKNLYARIQAVWRRSDHDLKPLAEKFSWNAGDLISNKSNLNMNVTWDCLFNEIEEYTEFNAWWYCCFPMDVVSEENLPLPIFIRGDDLEYGLRNMKHLILMNGICVWHEPFENKYSSFLEYYIIRNRLVDNTFHFPDWGKAQLKKAVWGQWRRECKFYRYKNVDLHTRGVRDFLKGVDFFLNTDGEKLHKEIMAAGYKAVPMDQISVPFHYKTYEASRTTKLSILHNTLRKLTLNGYLLPAKHIRIVSMAQVTFPAVWRAKKIVFYDVTANKAFECERSWGQAVAKFFQVLGLTIQIDFKYNKAKKDFLKRGNEIKNIQFWSKYLGLDKQ